MDVLAYLESVVYKGRPGVAAQIVRGALIALSWLYQAALWVYMLPFDMGLRKQKRLRKPVVSVGNITVGGTGKTPTVQYICRGLVKRGLCPAVLSYGYGGSLGGKIGVVSDRDSVLLDAEVSGDEPNMLARSLPGVPVLVGKDRYPSGSIAINEMGVDLLVLDDGFQVWKLHRDLDIVLLRSDMPFDNYHTLPAGRLRESIRAVDRADCIIVTGGDIPAEVRERFANKPVFSGKFIPSVLVSLADGSESSLDMLRGKRVLAVSAIANPSAFEVSLLDIGATLVGTERLLDHHSYTDEDIERINESAKTCSAEVVVTTDKDAVKLQRSNLDLPVFALQIGLELNDEETFWELVRRNL